MQTCSGKKGTRHEDVAFVDGYACPVCEAIEERDDLKDELRSANEKMMFLDEIIEESKKQIAELQAVENVNER